MFESAMTAVVVRREIRRRQPLFGSWLRISGISSDFSTPGHRTRPRITARFATRPANEYYVRTSHDTVLDEWKLGTVLCEIINHFDRDFLLRDTRALRERTTTYLLLLHVFFFFLIISKKKYIYICTTCLFTNVVNKKFF